MPKTPPRPRLDIYPDEQLLEDLDTWIKAQPGKLLGRAEAARQIVAERIAHDRAEQVAQERATRRAARERRESKR